MNNDSFGSSPISKGDNVEGDELCEFDKYISRKKRQEVLMLKQSWIII